MTEPFDSLDRKLMTDWFAPKGLRERILYHYTNAEGALGILRSGVLRGTSAGYMNDMSEIKYGIGVCESVLEQEIRCCTDDVVRRLLEGVRMGVEPTELPFEVFVTSFTEARDDLSQWRAYGSSGSGYALGFQLAGFSERDILRFPQRVEYDRTVQERRVREGIRTVVDVFQQEEARNEFVRAHPILMFHLRRLACIFKHPGFSAEREWRAVATLNAYDSPVFELNVAGGAFKPHVSMLTGSRTSGHLPLVELRVGHASDRAQAMNSAQMLLRRYGYDHVHLEVTEIPYRA